MNGLSEGGVAGYGRLAARAPLLDRINVYPVADGDTGTNLRISLAPLQHGARGLADSVARLKWCAAGNSGNIAAAFFTEFFKADCPRELAGRAGAGYARARQAVGVPREGTMLSVFKELSALLERHPVNGEACGAILGELHGVVQKSAQCLPELRAAGVVDAGALGMYLFFDGFFRHLTGYADNDLSLERLFPEALMVRDSYRLAAVNSHCVDLVLRPAADRAFGADEAALLGDSVVVLPGDQGVKVHIHTPDPQELRRQLERYGEILFWSAEPMVQNGDAGQITDSPPPASLHVMTDAAGSLSPQLARECGITLLDSYIVRAGIARPESCCAGQEVYARMRRGERLTTAQASRAERYQQYRAACEEHGATLYLAVGSAFTGNFATACAWKKAHDDNGLLTVVDSGAASGKLAVIALLTARFSARHSGRETLARARMLVECCQEYIFVDTLRYLVAGGRVSRTGGFLGDLLRLKPVISPTMKGAVKVGMVGSRQAQLDFAEKRLIAHCGDWQRSLVLLQYADNEPWVAQEVRPRLAAMAPGAEIVVQPLSLTSGVHMGPGTWAIAFGPVA
ncbi:MAG: DegV family protein [Desulfopila sp.]